MLGSPDASPVFGTTGLDNADFPGFGADILGTAVFGASGIASCSPFSQDYIPRKDTCIRAFVRLLAAQNASP